MLSRHEFYACYCCVNFSQALLSFQSYFMHHYRPIAGTVCSKKDRRLESIIFYFTKLDRGSPPSLDVIPFVVLSNCREGGVFSSAIWSRSIENN